MNNMKKIIYLLIIPILTACGDSNIPYDVTWEIVKEESNAALNKSNIEIKLNKKIDEQILKEIAQEIRSSRTRYDNLWIAYYIPGMTKGMAWATTHYTPELEIGIMGSTELEDEETAKTNDINGEVLNKWRSEKSLMGGTLVLYRTQNAKLIMRTSFKDGSSAHNEITETTENGQIKYDDENGHGEYYLVESNGHLGLYGANGKFDEAIKID